jgi:hypothetical protein
VPNQARITHGNSFVFSEERVSFGSGYYEFARIGRPEPRVVVFGQLGATSKEENLSLSWRYAVERGASLGGVLPSPHRSHNLLAQKNLGKCPEAVIVIEFVSSVAPGLCTFWGTPSPHTSESLDGGGFCKMCLQNIEP